MTKMITMLQRAITPPTEEAPILSPKKTRIPRTVEVQGDRTPRETKDVTPWSTYGLRTPWMNAGALVDSNVTTSPWVTLGRQSIVEGLHPPPVARAAHASRLIDLLSQRVFIGPQVLYGPQMEHPQRCRRETASMVHLAEHYET